MENIQLSLNSQSQVFFTGLHQRVHVLSGVCLSVILLTTSCKHYLSDLLRNFTRNLSMDKKELIKCWTTPTSIYKRRNFESILQYCECEIKHFSTIWLIYGKNDCNFVKTLPETYLWTSPLNRIHPGGGMCTPSDRVIVIHSHQSHWNPSS